MQPDTRQRFQGKCLVSTEGRQWMCDHYDDRIPPEARSLLQSSTFNLCAACVYEEAERRAGNYKAAIDHIEAAVLAENGPFGPQPVNTAPLVARPRRRHASIPLRPRTTA